VEPSTPPLLLVLVENLGTEDLAGLAPTEVAATTPTQLIRPPRDPIGYLLGDGDAVQALRDGGIAVDRSNLALESTTPSPQKALLRLRSRATGTAPVTILATRLAPGDRRAARAELDAFLGEVAEVLRRGERCETWLAGLGGEQPVRKTFDFAGHWRNACRWPLSADVRVTVQATRAIVRAADARSFAMVRQLLERAPFREHGTIAPARGAELAFAAHDGIAFGSHPQWSRRASTSSAAALWPRAAGPCPAELAFADWLAAFWLRAYAVHGVELPTPAVSRPSPALERRAWVDARVDARQPSLLV
jgi:hypothetical protein